MVFRLYCVRDKVAKECGPVFQAVNDGVASRSVVRLMADVAAYDRDAFELLYIGTYDNEVAKLVSLEPEVISFTIPRFEDVKGREFKFAEE